jgi:hypothetical protein
MLKPCMHVISQPSGPRLLLAAVSGMSEAARPEAPEGVVPWSR